MKIALLPAALLVALFASCGSAENNGKTSSGTTSAGGAATINDAKLAPFMYGGVYFFHGYGGGRQTLDNLVKGQMSSTPGDDGFLDELHTVYTNYFYYPFKPEDGAGARSTLSEAWEITDKASFQKGQADLLASGHQAEYDRLSAAGAAATGADEQERLAFINAHRAEAPEGGIKAWDLARYVNNTAMGYAAGYITQAEGDAMLAKVPELAHKHYKSWDAYWKGYNFGRKYWGGDVENDAAFDRTSLEMQQGEYNPFKYMPW